ncbi:histidinol-phosphate transaminase [Coprinellus micaceus]|uniref:histidinol-phosphate transaminase n=1 Tax=Coprinellus micaceus TaxID=71717 RepID=A0A4Y7T724_COPMI|nr:histidinol-phosphate transaminase [Coprinellus micaceus]
MAIQSSTPNQPQPYPAHFKLESVVRPNILALHPYRCARDDYSEGILLDANENALGHAIVSQGPSDDEAHVAVEETLALPLHRYPDPVHLPIKARIASLRSLPAPENVFLGVGSDEVLDLLIRIFVKPGISNTGNDKILITPPTYGMYSVCAQVNDVDVVKVPLGVREGEIDGSEGGKNGRFSVDVEAVKKAVIREQRELGNAIKIIFLCSPGNPTGTLIDLDAVRELLEWEEFKGVVIVDEAYIDFVGSAEDADPDAEIYKRSAAQFIGKYDNVVVTQTLSKSFGLAGIRLGIALAPIPIVQILANTKAPYNISVPTAHLASKALSPESLSLWRKNIRTLKHNRTFLVSSLTSLSQSTLPDSTLSLGVGPIIGSNDANFVLVRILKRGAKVGELKPDSTRAQKVYKYLAEEVGVVVRYRGNELGCEGALRITVGTEKENKAVLEKLVGALGKI